MPKANLYDMAGKQIGEVELSESIFGIEPNQYVVHDVVKNHLANCRQGTQSALTRAEVSGGGRKPWRQKGTGHARQGSTRAPQWTHGGIVFAPKPRDYSYTLNKKVKRLALKSALSAKAASGDIVVVDGLNLDEIKTETMRGFLDTVGAQKAVVVAPEGNAVVRVACSLTSGDRRAVEKCFVKAGVKEVTLVEAPLSLLAYTGSIGGLFLDIGGGKTEVAAVTNRGIACGVTVNIAGDAFNAAIIDDIYMNYGVKLGDYTVEKIKTSALSFYLNDEGSYAVSGGGRDGAPKSVAITAADMRDAVLPLVDDIIEVVMNVLDRTPPELSAEILRKGIFLTGGSARIPGLKEYLEQAFELPLTHLSDGPSSVAIGGMKFLEDKRFLSDLLGIKLD